VLLEATIRETGGALFDFVERQGDVSPEQISSRFPEPPSGTESLLTSIAGTAHLTKMAATSRVTRGSSGALLVGN